MKIWACVPPTLVVCHPDRADVETCHANPLCLSGRADRETKYMQEAGGRGTVQLYTYSDS